MDKIPSFMCKNDSCTAISSESRVTPNEQINFKSILKERAEEMETILCAANKMINRSHLISQNNNLAQNE
jgi:hypothetical protein